VVFRRRRSEQPDPAGVDETVDPTDEDETDDDVEVEVEAAPAPAAVFDRSAGPYDVSEVPEDGLVRLDLGGLRVPGIEGMELRLDLDETGENVMAATMVADESAVQLMAFAAPRTEGIWDEVRDEIRVSLAAQGPVEEAMGVFGRELLATLPVAGPQGQSGIQPVRFVGVDGPRWFLRGLFSGPAARNAAAAEHLEAILRATVVVRGSDPMAPGDLLALRLPDVDQAEPAEVDEQGRPRMAPPERGPEITEIR
jgi:hypothetical protein